MNATLVRQPPATMRFALEPYSEKLVQEMRPLWDMHNAEIPQLGMKVDPDLTLYSTAEKIGTLRIYTARLGTGHDSVLGGYQVFFMMRHPHRRYSLEANQDIIYLDPELRRGMVGTIFIKWVDEQLKKEGVGAIHRQISAQKDFGYLLERMNYRLMDLTYARRI